MAEHTRAFLHPEIDRQAHVMLESAGDPSTLAAAAVGRKVFAMALKAERLPNSDAGERWLFRDADGNPATVEFRDPSAIAAWVLQGSKGMFYSFTADREPLWVPDIGETRIPEDVRTDYPESDGLVAVTTALHHATRMPRRLSQGIASVIAPIRDRWTLAHWEPDTEQTKEEIMTHYDHDQSFFVGPQGILGDIPLYSSGLVFPGQGRISLEQMQRQKIDSILRLLQLDTAGSLLEIGTGWGEMAIQAAKKAPHLHVVTLTLSPEQRRISQRRIREAGLEDQIDVLEVDYRHLPREQQFDRLLTVEMMEAIPWQGLPDFFDAATELTDPENGRTVHQVITVTPEQEARQRYHDGFAQIIFPGGSLVALGSILSGFKQRGWKQDEFIDLTTSYPPTLRGWRSNEHMHEEVRTEGRVAAGVSRETSARSDRGHDLYIGTSETGFRTGNIQDWQIAFSRT